jgi:hypothetical protein
MNRFCSYFLFLLLPAAAFIIHRFHANFFGGSGDAETERFLMPEPSRRRAPARLSPVNQATALR